MMIKANGEYLDFNGDIEIESQIKLFEEIATSNGDYSYDIKIQDNGLNRKILGIPRADVVKIIYQAVHSEIIDDTGQSIYTGKLQVNRIEGGFISSTFFSGNTEWFAQLSEPMSSLPLYRYDVEINEANIMASWLEDEGIVFPIVDAGVLIGRSFTNMKIEDFTSAFYVKTLFNEIFNPKGIKTVGDLINDATFKKLVVMSNKGIIDENIKRSSYAGKTSDQTLISSSAAVLFQNDTTNPFFDGNQDNYNSSTSEYTSDVRMRVDVSVNLSTTWTDDAALEVALYINGLEYETFWFIPPVGIGTDIANFSFQLEDILLDTGDVLTIFAIPHTITGITIKTGSKIKITSTYIYKAFGVSSVPQWTQGQFVSNILRLFNVLPSFNTNTKTLTLDLFNNIKSKPHIDISQEVVINAVDYSEFVSNYAKNNYFLYQESEDEDLKEYNISNFISYGSGNLTINNDYIENSANIVESDFTSPITYLNGIFDMSMERFNFIELEEINDVNITSVSDSSGTPRFNISNANDTFTVGDLVRIKTVLDSYSGDWVIKTVTSTYIEVNGNGFNATTTGTAKLMRHQFTTDDNVYIFINIPNTPITSFSSQTEIYLEDNTTFTSAAIAYFNLLNNGTSINKTHKQSLSFGVVNNPLSYQLTLLQTYWPLFSRMLNDPVKLLASGNLKRTTFNKIKTFLRPVMIQTEETTNLYYLNRNRGYKGSEQPCELQLIKLN